MVAVLFDLDGTIAGNSRRKSEVMDQVANKFGVPGIKREDYLKAFKKVVNDKKLDNRVPIFKEIVGDRALAEKIAEEYRRRSLEGIYVYEDAKDLLENLTVKMGLVTNGPREVQWEKIKMLNIEKYFDTILVSGELGESKPQSKIFQIAMNSLKSKPIETMYVGDVPGLDVVGAKAAGLIAVLINRDGKKVDYSPDYEVKDLREVYQIVKSMGG